jgi:hypothetical protein
MHSKRSHEGYLMIDNRESPGVSDEALRAMGPALPPGAGRGMFEAPTITCSHCQTVLIVNPLRTRERAYCAKCDHYICDGCGTVLAASGVCRPFAQIIAETQEAAMKAAPIIIAP